MDPAARDGRRLPGDGRALSGERTSPFARALGPDADRLGPILSRRYVAEAPSAWQGRVARMSYRPRWLWPWHRLLQAFGLVVASRGEDLPTTAHVRIGEDGTRFHEQRFWAPRERMVLRAFRFDPRRNRLVSRHGPFRLFELTWDLRIRDARTLEMECADAAWRVGRLRIPLPRFSWVRIHVRERDLGTTPSAIAFVWRVADPLLGTIFECEGELGAASPASSLVEATRAPTTGDPLAP